MVRPPGPKQCTTAKLRPGPLHGPAAIEARVPRAARLLPVAGLTGRSAAGEDWLTRNLVYGWGWCWWGRLVGGIPPEPRAEARHHCKIAARPSAWSRRYPSPVPRMARLLAIPGLTDRSAVTRRLVGRRRCRYRSLAGGRQPPHPKRGSTADRPGGARPRPPPPGGGRAADRARRSGGAGRRRSSCGTPPRRPPTGRPSEPRG